MFPNRRESGFPWPVRHCCSRGNVAVTASLLALSLPVVTIAASIQVNASVRYDGRVAGGEYSTFRGLSSGNDDPNSFTVSAFPTTPGALIATVAASGPGAIASSTANLQSVTIRSFASSASPIQHGAFTTTELFDRLTIVNGTGSTALVGVQFTVHGEVGPGPMVLVTSSLDFGQAALLNRYYNPGPRGVVNQFDFITGWDSYSVSDQDEDIGFVFSGNYALRPGTNILTFRQRLNLSCNGNTCDFDDTAAFGMTLPSGVSFTSESGVFLAEATSSPVPEPSTFFIVGIAVLCGSALRARGHSEVPASIPAE